MPAKRSVRPESELGSDTRHSRVRWSAGESPRVPGLSILCHPDSSRIGERVALLEASTGGTLELSRLEPRFAQPGDAEARPLESRHLSRSPVCLSFKDSGQTVEIDCSRTSTSVAIGGSWVADRRTLAAAEIERGAVLVLAERVVLLLHPLQPSPPAELPDFGLVGESPAMIELRQQLERVLDLDVPVLLCGETGTGKELVASALHRFGARSQAPFLTLNMAAVPPSLAASELFGAARGAFTGADRSREGYFARAAGGTLFLDEVGEMPGEVQALLLRVLERGEIQPVGGSTSRTVDVRVIAATDSNLEARIDAGEFRAPLLHRLSGYQIRVPALLQRRDDIGRLLLYFLRQELTAVGEADRLEQAEESSEPWLPAQLVAQLAEYDWPGNVRQLRNVARELVISGRGARQVGIGPQVEKLLHSPPPPPEAETDRKRSRLYRQPSEISDTKLAAVLQRHRFRLKPTAAELGMSRTSLYDRIKKSTALRTAAEMSSEEIESCFEDCAGDLEAMVDRLQVSKEGIRLRLRQLGLRRDESAG